MTQLEHTAEWHAYVAGFFDGEGSVSIARVRANGKSDYHKIIVAIGQRTEHAAVLHRVAYEFGGIVSDRMQRSRVGRRWAPYSHWQLQNKADIVRFLETIAPYVVIKRKQIEIGLEFIRAFAPSTEFLRDGLGQYRGWVLSREQVDARERLRLAMRAANELGPPKALPSTMPPLGCDLRLTEAELIDARWAPDSARHRQTRLMPATVIAIRVAYAQGNANQRQLAERYGVARRSIGDVINRISYRYVDDALAGTNAEP